MQQNEEKIVDIYNIYKFIRKNGNKIVLLLNKVYIKKINLYLYMVIDQFNLQIH